MAPALELSMVPPLMVSVPEPIAVALLMFSRPLLRVVVPV